MPRKDPEARRRYERDQKRKNADSINHSRRILYHSNEQVRAKCKARSKKQKLTPAQKLAKSERESRRRDKRRVHKAGLHYLQTRSVINLKELDSPDFIVEHSDGHRTVEHWKPEGRLVESPL